MVIRATLFCDNNGGSHYAELSAWKLSDVHYLEHATNTLDDLVAELRKQAKAEGWLLMAANGWTRVSCPACCGGQGGG